MTDERHPRPQPDPFQPAGADAPERVFAVLADDPIDDRILDDVSRAVSAAIASDGGRGGRRWLPIAASWAAGVALAAALVPWGFRAVTPEPEAGFGRIATGIDAVRLGERVSMRAGVQVVDIAETTRVVDLTVGDTQVVMIFDERLEL